MNTEFRELRNDLTILELTADVRVIEVNAIYDMSLIAKVYCSSVVGHAKKEHEALFIASHC